MSQEQTGGASHETWWDGLSDDEQQGLMQLEEGEPVPEERVGSLVAGGILAPDESGAVHVDQGLASFLAEKREGYGGYTV